MKPVKLSIIIPTYKRPELLSVALQSLINQTTQTDFEIIVVDNDPKRSARPVVFGFNLSPLPRRQAGITYHLEPKLGHSHAKNAGLNKARGRYCLFLDDDAKVGPNFIAYTLSIIEGRKAPLIFGGPIKPYFSQGRPKWFKPAYESRTFGRRQITLGPKQYLSTSSTFISRHLLVQIGGFNPAQGIKGSCRRFGEDTAVLRRIYLRYPKLTTRYYPRLVVWHHTPLERTTLGYHLARVFQVGASGPAVTGTQSSISKICLKAISASLWLLIGYLWAGLFRNRKSYPYWQNFVYERVHPSIYWLGALRYRISAL